MQDLAQEPLVHVYVPTSPNPTSGYFLLVPEREVIAVNISVEEAMRELIVSGGLYSPTSPLGSLMDRTVPNGGQSSNRTQECRWMSRRTGTRLCEGTT